MLELCLWELTALSIIEVVVTLTVRQVGPEGEDMAPSVHTELCSQFD